MLLFFPHHLATKEYVDNIKLYKGYIPCLEDNESKTGFIVKACSEYSILYYARSEDIPLLIGHFVSLISARWGMPAPPLDVASLDRLMSYSWPGNVRELVNLVERVLILEPNGPLNFAKHLPKDPAWYVHSEEGNDYLQNLIDDRLKAVLSGYSGTASKEEEFYPAKSRGEKSHAQGKVPSLNAIMIEHITKALIMSKGKINGPGGAAEILQLHPNTLRKRMLKLGICKSYLTGATQK